MLPLPVLRIPPQLHILLLADAHHHLGKRRTRRPWRRRISYFGAALRGLLQHEVNDNAPSSSCPALPSVGSKTAARLPQNLSRLKTGSPIIYLQLSNCATICRSTLR